MAYLVLAYPELSTYDFGQIQNYRETNDELFIVVDPHFTIVFPVLDIPEAEFIREIKEKAAHRSKFDFSIHYATLHKDEIKNHFNVFLVPDKGFNPIVNLHDKLYSGKLNGSLRLDLDYVPHIRIGNTNDQFLSRKMVDEWNAKEVFISGTISSLSIVNYKNDIVTRMQEIELVSSQ